MIELGHEKLKQFKKSVKQLDKQLKKQDEWLAVEYDPNYLEDYLLFGTINNPAIFTFCLVGFSKGEVTFNLFDEIPSNDFVICYEHLKYVIEQVKRIEEELQ